MTDENDMNIEVNESKEEDLHTMVEKSLAILTGQSKSISWWTKDSKKNNYNNVRYNHFSKNNYTRDKEESNWRNSWNQRMYN